MLAFEDPPTAVFAGQHWVGRGAMRAMHNAGTPMDLAVFDGVDDNDLLITPPLVVAASGPERIGQLAAELLVDRLGGLREEPRHAVLAPVLLGPGERWVRSAGTVERVVVQPPTAPAHARPHLNGTVHEHAKDGLVPAKRTRRRTSRTEPITG